MDRAIHRLAEPAQAKFRRSSRGDEDAGVTVRETWIA
jgi:hypothetical protein